VNRFRARVERVERGHGVTPHLGPLALRRLPARDTLGEETHLQHGEKSETHLAAKEGPSQEPVDPTRDRARRCEPPPRRGRFGERSQHLCAVFAVTAMSVLHTWPLAIHMRGLIAGGLDDTWMNVWHVWWMRRALVEHPTNPFFSSILHWPIGAEMYWHTLAVAKTVWGAVLIPLLAPETAYNLLILASFVATGYTAWLLCRDLLRRAGTSPTLAWAAAFTGACTFDFSRYHLAQAHAHLNLASLEGIPLYLLFFLRWLEKGKRKDLVGLGVAALYTVLCDYYYLLYEALFSLAWLAADRWRRGALLSRAAFSDPLVQRGGWSALSAFAFTLPVLAALLAHAYPAPLSIHHGDSDYYADLAGFFVPDRYSGWLPSMPSGMQSLAERLPGNLEEGGYFIGWLTPLLCLFAIRRGAPEGTRWLGIGAGFAVLSMGALLSIGSIIDLSPAIPLAILVALFVWLARSSARPLYRDLAIVSAAATILAIFFPFTTNGVIFKVRLPMPYLVFKHLVPFFSRGGMPVRLESMLTVSIAVLAGYAAAELGKLAASRMTSARTAAIAGPVAAVLVVAIPSLEYLDRPMEEIPIPTRQPIFDEIARAPADQALFTDGTVRSEYEQIWHGHPITYARLSRMPVREAKLLSSRLYRVLIDDRQVSPLPAEEEATHLRGDLAAFGFKWYIAHYFDPNRDRFVREVLHGREVFRDSQIVAYQFE